jgi:uncharacterized membrane protein YjfL (UPF0719 family)
MYITSVIELLSWPAIIVLSYFAIRWVLKKYEENIEKQHKDANK